jgi:hypothetical protein
MYDGRVKSDLTFKTYVINNYFFTRRICGLASLERQIFLLVKKSITLLTHNWKQLLFFNKHKGILQTEHSQFERLALL